MYTTCEKADLYLMLDDLSEGQVEVNLTFPEELQVTAAAAWLSLALDSVGQLQLNQASFEAYSPH